MCSYPQRLGLFNGDTFRNLVIILSSEIEFTGPSGFSYGENVLQPQIDALLLVTLSQCSRKKDVRGKPGRYSSPHIGSDLRRAV